MEVCSETTNGMQKTFKGHFSFNTKNRDCAYLNTQCLTEMIFVQIKSLPRFLINSLNCVNHKNATVLDKKSFMSLYF